MNIPCFLTTTTAPPWGFTFADASGNVPPNFLSAVCTLTFRSRSSGAKIRGTGTFMPINSATGFALYTLAIGPPPDLANVYAISALGINNLPGTELFDLFPMATVGSLEYDGTNMPQIYIEKL
jgi:hypothetical protein